MAAPTTITEAVDLLDSPTAAEVRDNPFIHDFSERELASDAIARVLSVEVGPGAEPLEWTDVTWQSGWSNFGSGYGDVEFAVDEVAGVVLFSGVGVGGGDELAFTLPAGARPSVKRILNVGNSTGLANADVGTDGTVTFFTGGGAAVLVFDGKSFRL